MDAGRIGQPSSKGAHVTKRLTAVLSVLLLLAAAPAALAAGSLSGTFKTKLTGAKYGGTWKVTFTQGKYSVTDNGRAIVHGKFTLKGAAISLTDTGGPGKCAGTGKYTYTLKGKTLTVKKVSDAGTGCAGRVAVLTTHPLTKVS
jgi:hypothetical protein